MKNKKIISLLLTSSLLLNSSGFLVVASAITSDASEETSSDSVDVKTTAVTFVDAAFEAEIRKALSKPDGEAIMQSDLDGIGTLTCIMNSNIKSLEDFKKFNNLERLSISNLGNLDITPLGGIPSLKTLSFSNDIIDVSKITELKDTLESLKLSNVTLVSASSLTQFTSLGSLDVTTNLIVKSGDSTDISEFPVLNTVTKTSISVDNLDLVKPLLTKLPNVSELTLSGFGSRKLLPLDVVPFPEKIVKFYVSGLQANTISKIVDFTALDKLEITHSNLVDENVSELNKIASQLSRLNISYNLLTKVPVLSNLSVNPIISHNFIDPAIPENKTALDALQSTPYPQRRIVLANGADDISINKGQQVGLYGLMKYAEISRDGLERELSINTYLKIALNLISDNENVLTIDSPIVDDIFDGVGIGVSEGVANVIIAPKDVAQSSFNKSFKVNVTDDKSESVTVVAIDVESGKELKSESFQGAVGELRVNALSVDGYTVEGASHRDVTLVKGAPLIVEFEYSKNVNVVPDVKVGKITIECVDEADDKVINTMVQEIKENLFGTPIMVVAPKQKGYTAIDKSSSVTLTEENPNVTVRFKYKKGGSLEDLMDPSTVKELVRDADITDAIKNGTGLTISFDGLTLKFSNDAVKEMDKKADGDFDIYYTDKLNNHIFTKEFKRAWGGDIHDSFLLNNSKIYRGNVSLDNPNVTIQRKVDSSLNGKTLNLYSTIHTLTFDKDKGADFVLLSRATVKDGMVEFKVPFEAVFNRGFVLSDVKLGDIGKTYNSLNSKNPGGNGSGTNGDDNLPDTSGMNGVLPILGGLVALSGAAFVYSSKKKK